MYNPLPWWLTWIDGRALLLIILLAATWAWYWISLNDADANTYDETDCCKACGEHIADAHQPDCALDSDAYDD